jgi:DNA invertase Pin-like site-specific DNA recombinase
MKTAEETHVLDKLDFHPPIKTLGRVPSSKVLSAHLDKLAVVYVRQSTTHQVQENRESTARQYAFAEHAISLGWPRERVLIIDEDLGKSGRTAEGRSGFQRLVSEVTLKHVGLVLGLEMSRLARSSRDWHNLFEMCGICGSLLADEDGLYDANDPNDRLVLGMKGLMSEMELHIMRNRLLRGRDNKAQRGELFHSVPMGYVILPTGEVDFDPDEQAREVMQLVFDKFQELGTIYGVFHWLLQHDLQMPVRARTGAKKGQLTWRRPSMATLAEVLRHPIYAGAYAFGRRLKVPNGPCVSGNRHRHCVPMDPWKVLIKDRLPAYLTWDQYLKNRERIKQNQNGCASPGVPRRGAALLAGLLVCGNCGRRMRPSYHAQDTAQYACHHQYLSGVEESCYGLAAKPIDTLVSQQVLAALEPAALELSVKAQADVERERQRLEKHWQQRRQRARYDVELAERRYQAVDPANRLVASTLEERWEDALQQERQLQEEYNRFANETQFQLAADQLERITALAADIPALWKAPRTTNADRKEMIRCLVERVVVHVRCDSEFVDVTIHWAGGYESQHEIIRPVGTYAQLRDFEQLMNRIVELRQAGRQAPEIAETLDEEGFYPPKGRGRFTKPIIYQLLKRRGLIGDERAHDELLDQGEWWLTDLAREFRMSHLKLRDWALRGWVHGRQTPIQSRWIVWADKDEVHRLSKLLAESRRGVNTYASELKTPKERPKAK